MLSSPAPLLGDLFSENIGKREVLAAEDLLDFSQCRRLLAICKTIQLQQALGSLVDRPQDVVCLLGKGHRYSIVEG